MAKKLFILLTFFIIIFTLIISNVDKVSAEDTITIFNVVKTVNEDKTEVTVTFDVNSPDGKVVSLKWLAR